MPFLVICVSTANGRFVIQKKKKSHPQISLLSFGLFLSYVVWYFCPNLSILYKILTNTNKINTWALVPDYSHSLNMGSGGGDQILLTFEEVLGPTFLRPGPTNEFAPHASVGPAVSVVATMLISKVGSLNTYVIYIAHPIQEFIHEKKREFNLPPPQGCIQTSCHPKYRWLTIPECIHNKWVVHHHFGMTCTNVLYAYKQHQQ